MTAPAFALPAPRAVLADAIPGARTRDAAPILGASMPTAWRLLKRRA